MGTDDRSGGPDPFDDRLRAALRLEARRTAVRVDVDRVRAAVAAGLPPRGARLSRGVAALVATILIVGGVSAGIALRLTGAPAAPERAGRPSSAATPSAMPPTATPGPITLADCQIEPVSSPLAFRGWATVDALKVLGGAAARGQPVYALITRGLAEWVGWRTPGGAPIFPQPIGRMGCVFDPSTGVISQVGVPLDWTPPTMIDGCPASAEGEFAGYREVGGPRAWVLLPTRSSSWTSGTRLLLLYRMSPPLGPHEVMSAWAQRLAGGLRVDGVAGTGSTALPPGGLRGGGTQRSQASYYLVEQRFPSPGCWVLDVAVNGSLAGSAIVSVAMLPTPPSTP